MEEQTITITPRKARAALEEVRQVFMEGKKLHEFSAVGREGVWYTLRAAINAWAATLETEPEPAAEGEPVPA